MKDQKKVKLMEILGIAILLMLGGCLGKDGSVKGQDKTDGASSAETSGFYSLRIRLTKSKATIPWMTFKPS